MNNFSLITYLLGQKETINRYIRDFDNNIPISLVKLDKR
jgi:hypothetical protein